MGHACCGPPAPTPSLSEADGADDAPVVTGVSNASRSAPGPDPARRGCCPDTPAPAATDTACADACCRADTDAAREPVGEMGPESDGGGGASPPEKAPPSADSPPVADCCRGKPSPCCDEACLDRLALRGCAVDACAVAPDSASSCADASSRGRQGDPCRRHRLSARNRYGALLEQLGCICRALIALGQESCCETKGRPTARQRATSKHSFASSLTRSSFDSCCAGNVPSKSRATGRARRQKSAGGCCGTAAKQARSSPRSFDPCCAPEDAKCGAVSSSNSLRGADAAIGCVSPEPATTTSLRRAIAADAENQASGSEHVVLCVSGMTCTGCETKLQRTLATVAGVRNLKTSLVLSRADFDIDLGLAAVDDVMKHLERTTEFTCERITSSGSSIEVSVPGDASVLIDRPWPAGVTDMARTGKDTVRITFDAKLVGARDLVDAYSGKSLTLAPVRGDPGLEAGGRHLRQIGYMTILSAVLTVPVLVMAWAPLPERDVAYGSASLALATLVQVMVAGPFYPKAVKALVFSRVVEMDLLIVLSSSTAYIFSVVSFAFLVAQHPLSTGQFFETSTLLVTLIMVGRYVAALARQKAVESISLGSLQASSALLVDGAAASSEREIDVRLLQYGDFFKVLPDSRIPTDGTVVAGSSEVDESMLTGESHAVEKQVKSRVIAGTVNGSGTLVVRLTRLPGDNTITAIAAMVDEAKLSKPKLQEMADRVASYFVPVVVALTTMTFVIWAVVGVTVVGKSASAAVVDALTYAITVLIVSCPCAIGLAVPMVVVIASGVAAERGVIFKSASAIEVAHKASHVVFDKTGTLTQGKLSVVSEHCAANQDETLALLLGLVGESRHPVSAAVAAHLRGKGVAAASVSDTRSLTGRGLQGQAAGRTLCAGNARWLQLSSDAAVARVLSQKHTAFCFTVDGALAAVFGLEDSLRADAQQVVATLQARGIAVHVVSGDDDGAVRRVAVALAIPAQLARGGSSPADKEAYVARLLTAGGGAAPPVVVFCGDGTNDAVALARATVGVQMHEGSDAAQSAADVVLMRPALAGLVTALRTSRRCVRRVRFNLAWSFAYNAAAVLLAAGAFVRVRIPPAYAGLGELVSVLPVIAVAVLLRWSSDGGAT